MLRLAQRSPRRLRVLAREATVAAGRSTSGLRMLPSVVLAGAQRSGTTTMFRALLDHPQVLQPSQHKGVNYFDVHYDRGPDWYRAHFPLRLVAELRTRGSGGEPVTLDTSGYYLYHPHAAPRLGRDLPEARVVVLLRDPVERAFSSYRHALARGLETEPFERALALEDERVQPDLDRMLSDPAYVGLAHRHHSYRRRGQYAEQLERMLAAVGPERLLVLESADFFADPARAYRRVTDFLGLAPHLPLRFGQWNARPGAAMSQRARARLVQAYEPHDEALTALLGEAPSWRR